MKKYGHLVTSVGQNNFSLSLPAGCLSPSTPAFISVAGTHQSSKKWGKQPPSRAFPHHPAKVTVSTSMTTALATTIGNKAMAFFFYILEAEMLEKLVKPWPKAIKKKKKPSWIGSKTFVIFRKENKWCTQLLSKQSWLTQMQLTSKLCFVGQAQGPEAELQGGKHTCRPPCPNTFY